MLNEGNKRQNFISSFGSGTLINYGYGSSSGSTALAVQCTCFPDCTDHYSGAIDIYPLPR